MFFYILQLVCKKLFEDLCYLSCANVITGKEIFVGVGKFTNEAGARAVAAAFPEFPCMPIKVRIKE